MSVIVRIVGAADGSSKTPHDGRFVGAWNPHTKAGTLELSSTSSRKRALKFPTPTEAMIVWNTVSRVQPLRPWDGKPNKPLTGVTVEILAEDDSSG